MFAVLQSDGETTKKKKEKEKEKAGEKVGRGKTKEMVKADKHAQKTTTKKWGFMGRS